MNEWRERIKGKKRERKGRNNRYGGGEEKRRAEDIRYVML
jgi:hypothetical protein